MLIRMLTTETGGLGNGAAKRFKADRAYRVPADMPAETAEGFIDSGAAVVLENKAKAAAPQNKASAPAVAPNGTFPGNGAETMAGSDGRNSGKRPVLSARGPRAGKSGGA